MVHLLSNEFDPLPMSMRTDATTKTRRGENVDGSNYPEILTELQDDDVLLGRGKSHINRTANICFRAIISNHRQLYFDAESQKHKKAITEDIMNQIGGRFLRRDRTQTGWVEIPREMARVKVAQALQYLQRSQDNSFDARGAQFRAAKRKSTRDGNRSTGSSVAFMRDHDPALIPRREAASDNVWQLLPLDSHETQQSVEFISDDEIHWALTVDPVQLRYHNQALEHGFATIEPDNAVIGIPCNEQLVSNHVDVDACSPVAPECSLVTPNTLTDFQHTGQYMDHEGHWYNESMLLPGP